MIQVFSGAGKDESPYRHLVKAVEAFCKAVSGRCPAELCRLKAGRHSKHLKILLLCTSYTARYI